MRSGQSGPPIGVPALSLTTATDANILLLQVFLLLTTLPVLCIAAVNSGRHKVVQLYHALLASLHDHVAILDARGIVLEVNDSWRRFADNALVERFHRVGVGDDYVAACRFAAERGGCDGDTHLGRCPGGASPRKSPL